MGRGRDRRPQVGDGLPEFGAPGESRAGLVHLLRQPTAQPGRHGPQRHNVAVTPPLPKEAASQAVAAA